MRITLQCWSRKARCVPRILGNRRPAGYHHFARPNWRVRSLFDPKLIQQERAMAVGHSGGLPHGLDLVTGARARTPSYMTTLPGGVGGTDGRFSGLSARLTLRESVVAAVVRPAVSHGRFVGRARTRWAFLFHRARSLRSSRCQSRGGPHPGTGSPCFRKPITRRRVQPRFTGERLINADSHSSPVSSRSSGRATTVSNLLGNRVMAEARSL